MFLLAPIIIALLNILTNHTMLTRKKTISYCVKAFIVNTLFVIILSIFIKNVAANPIVFKYAIYVAAFSYFGYIYLVFSDSFSIKLFSMFSSWVFSTIIISISNIVIAFDGVYNGNIYKIHGIRIALQLIFLLIAHMWYGEYFKKIVGKIQSYVTYLMSGYMFIALLLLINSSSWNNQIITNAKSIYEISLLIVFIIFGYFIVFFGISSSSKNALLLKDVNKLKKQSEIYYNLANYDALTGIANKQSIIKYLSEKLIENKNSKEQFIIILFDIDKFKSINDRYGHSVGDKALKFVVARVKHCLREEDFIGRFGGDEFIIMPKNIYSRISAEYLIDRIIESLEKPLITDKHVIPIDISIGVSVFPIDGETPDDLLDQADMAMYRAKKIDGTNYQFYSSI